jgi:MerR family redox-sensitive transcriptional activator SoxR
MSYLDIAEVSRRSGLPASTLRFYEEQRLIKSVGRRGLRRLFDPSVLPQLALIALARAGGFALEEIARMFAAESSWRRRRTRSTAPSAA